MPLLQIIDAADEVVDSVDKDELAKYFSVKNDPEDEGAEVRIYVASCFSQSKASRKPITEALFSILWYGGRKERCWFSVTIASVCEENLTEHATN